MPNIAQVIFEAPINDLMRSLLFMAAAMTIAFISAKIFVRRAYVGGLVFLILLLSLAVPMISLILPVISTGAPQWR